MPIESRATVLKFPGPKEQLEKLLAEQQEAEAKLARIKEDLTKLCRSWSDANGYRMILKPEQMKLALEAERDE